MGYFSSQTKGMSVNSKLQSYVYPQNDETPQTSGMGVIVTTISDLAPMEVPTLTKQRSHVVLSPVALKPPTREKIKNKMMKI